MHHICNIVRFCFKNNKNTTLKTQKHEKNIKKHKKCFLNCNKKHKTCFFYIYDMHQPANSLSCLSFCFNFTPETFLHHPCSARLYRSSLPPAPRTTCTCYGTSSLRPGGRGGRAITMAKRTVRPFNPFSRFWTGLPFDYKMTPWKFGGDISNGSGVTVLANKQTDRQNKHTPLKTTPSPLLRFVARPFLNHRRCSFVLCTISPTVEKQERTAEIV